MSTTQPGGPRRRRIAGERRRPGIDEELAQPDADTSQQASTSVDPVGEGPSKPTKPVKLTKPAATKTKTKKKPGSTAAGATEPTAKRRPTGWWGSRRSLMLLAGALVLLLALTGLVALGALGTDGVQDVREAESVEQSMRTAPAAAEAAAAAILAYDHKQLDADEDTASRFMTDEFATEYGETFEKVVRPAAEANQAKVTATVQASSVISATDDTARVLLFVDQATTSTANERPQIALNRVVMSMVREGDSWRVADISSY